MTKDEAIQLYKNLQYVFDEVRLVDVSKSETYKLDKNENFKKSEYKCHARWGKNKRCENCISAKAYNTDEKTQKFEFIGEDVYVVIAENIIIEDRHFIIEMVNKVNDEVMFGAFGKSDFVKFITNHNNKLYVDPVTNTYNRRYFEEQLQFLSGTAAVAIIDIDQLKEINAAYSRKIGNQVLRAICESIKQHTSNKDYIIRMDGDDFLLLLKEIDHDNLAPLLDKIREEIKESTKQILFNETNATVSIGGYYCANNSYNAIEFAENLKNKAQKKRDAIEVV